MLRAFLVAITLRYIFYFVNKKKGKRVSQVERTVLKRFSCVHKHTHVDTDIMPNGYRCPSSPISMLQTALYNISFCSYIINLQCGSIYRYWHNFLRLFYWNLLCVFDRWSSRQFQAWAHQHCARDFQEIGALEIEKIDPMMHTHTHTPYEAKVLLFFSSNAD